MKKLSLLLMPFCLLLVMSSCKKHSPSANGTGTINVTINGSAQTFNVGAIAHVDNTGDFHSLSLIGVQSAGTANSIILEITASSPIIAGTYTAAGSQADISYTLASGSVYQFDDSEGSGATIVVKSISSTNVQGTFSGTLGKINGDGPATQTLTNGTFNLNIK
jgi:hypothetical protein